MGIVDHDELAIQRLVHVQFYHVDAESHGRCKRSGSVLQDVCGSAAMSNNDGRHAVFWRSRRLLRKPPGLRYAAGWTLMMSKLGLRVEVFRLNLGIVVGDDLFRSPIVVMKDFEAYLTESGCQQAGTGELAAGHFTNVVRWGNLFFKRQTHELQHVLQIVGNADLAKRPADHGFTLHAR